MTYIARTRQWVSRSTVQRSRSSPGQTLCSQGATPSDVKAVSVCTGRHVHLRQRRLFIFAVGLHGDQLYATLALADVRPVVNTDLTWQLIDNWMSYGC